MAGCLQDLVDRHFVGTLAVHTWILTTLLIAALFL